MFLSKFRKAREPLFLGQTDDTPFHIGVDMKGRPIAMDWKTLKQHAYVTGTTGAGKTEALLGLMSNAFAWNGGGVFVDGKGDVSIFAKMAGMADHFDRRDDLYVLNFMTGNTHHAATGAEMRSHRFNPFERMGADHITQMLAGMLDFPGVDGPMWAGRCTAMLTGAMRVLTWLRDEHGRYLDIRTIRDAISLENLVDIAYSARHPGMPAHLAKMVRSYLESISGFDREAGNDQPDTVKEYHDHMYRPIAGMLGAWADVYGHIFAAGCSDIDFDDIVKNQRFLLVMLPALEKSRDEIATLGKIVLASLKSVVGSTLGREITGRWEDVISDRNPAGKPPFLCVFDEAAYYSVSGMDLFAAQARSLNIALIYASQDLAAVFRDRTARSIFTNTGTKIAMRTNDWSVDMDEVFNGAVAGRDDVESAVTARGGGKALFGTPRRFVSQLEEGDFLLVSSGKMVVGRAGYVTLMPTMPLALTRFNPLSAATKKIVAMEEARVEAKKGAGGETLSECLAKLCATGKADVVQSGGDLLAAALEAVGGAGMKSGTRTAEIVMTGA